MVFDLLSFLIGCAVGGIACVLSSKYLGFWNKQVTSVEKKV